MKRLLSTLVAVLALAAPCSAQCLLKQSTARNLAVLMVDSSDHVTGKTGLTLTITASKDGAAFASVTPTVTELATGWYSLALTTTHTNTLGDFELHVTGTAADPTDKACQVVADLPGASVSSVSGAVGSVTGNVGGNVVGSVASVTAGVTVTTNNDKSSYVLSAAGVQAIWDALTSALTTSGSVGKRIADDLDATISSRLASGSYTAPDNTSVSAIKTQTDKLTFTVTNQIDANVLDWKSSTAPAMTGDAFARLGAPAGASVSADVAAIKAVLPSALTSGGRMKASVEAILDTSFTEGGSGRIAAAFKQFFNIASPAATMDHGVLLDTLTTYAGNTPQTGDGFARLGAPAGASVSADVAAVKAVADAVKAKTDNLPGSPAATSDVPSAATVADAVWDEVQSGHTTSGTFGKYLDSQVSGAGGSLTAAGVWDYATSSITTAGSIGKLVKDDVDAAISTRLPSASYTAPLTAASTRTAVGLASANLDTQLAALSHLDADVSTRLPTSSYTAPDNASVTAIKAKTDNLPASPAATGAAMTLTGAYDAAKTAAQAGNAMTLTSGERTATAAVVWNSLTSGFSTVASIGKLFVDDLDAAVSSRGTFSGGAVASVTAPVTVGTNNDKTGYSLAATGNDSALPSATVVSDAGNSTTKVKTDRTETATDYWKDVLVLFTGGSCNIVGQVAKVTGYNGSTKVITWAPAKTAIPTTSCGMLFVNR